MEISAHFFRHESGRLLTALTRVFGLHNLALAEDVTQHAFCQALEIWKVHGVPERPSAWLLATAKHRALDVLRRERTARLLAPELSRRFDAEAELNDAVERAFLAGSIRDEQLRMMFSCCQPRLARDVQIALILNILCGFSSGELAGALLASQAAIEKRLSRGKHTLAESKALFDLGSGDFDARLETVRRALYLLFNEGYHGASQTAAIRQELCDEAIRLSALLLQHGPAATPTTLALAALMCLHAARLPARLDAGGDLLTFFEQDRTRWDAPLLAQGLALFEAAASGDELSPYHLEAAIAVTHASAPHFDATDWDQVVSLYDRLVSVAPSPVVALSRAIAIAERDGAERGLSELGAISDARRLRQYPFYAAALAELHRRLGHDDDARRHFQQALVLARNDTERRFLRKRLATLGH